MSDKELAEGQAYLVGMFSTILRRWKSGRLTVTVEGETIDGKRVFGKPPGVYDDRRLVFGHPYTVNLALATTYQPTDPSGGFDVNPELPTREALALAVLAGDGSAAGSALADLLIEEGFDWAETVQKRERGRAAQTVEDWAYQMDFISDPHTLRLSAQVLAKVVESGGTFSSSQERWFDCAPGG